jgi:hypothetical protein
MNLHPTILRPYVLLGLLVAAGAAATPQPASQPKGPTECVPQTPLAAAAEPATLLPPVHVRATIDDPAVLPRVHVVAQVHGSRGVRLANDRTHRTQPHRARAFR